MNEQWREDVARAHEAQAEALTHAADALRGVVASLDALEAQHVEGTIALLERAAKNHEEAARMVAVA